MMKKILYMLVSVVFCASSGLLVHVHAIDQNGQIGDLFGLRSRVNAHMSLTQAVGLNNEKEVQKMLGAGTNVNELSRDGYPPICIAACFANLNIIRRLLDKGADIDATNDKGNTALHMAAQEGRVEIVQFLLEAGADPEKQNKNGKLFVNLLSERLRSRFTSELVNDLRKASSAGKAKREAKKQDISGILFKLKESMRELQKKLKELSEKLALLQQELVKIK